MLIRKLRHEEEARQCAQFMVNSEPWKTLRRAYDGSMRMLLDPEREIYLALVEDEIAGFIILQMKGAFVGYIQTVGVFSAWQGQGIGSRLIQFAEERIFTESPNVFLCVSSFNERAQKLYRNLGYEEVGELKNYIVAGHSEILLRKTIAPLAAFRK
jgi:ribosomal protein S18 acetylase RimI-like enzyme